MLELAFATKELRTACEDAAYAETQFGTAVADALLSRLADLRAATHPLDSPFAQRLAATGDTPECVVVTLAAGRRLVLGANHIKPPRDVDGKLMWERVSRVIILRLD